MRFSQPRGHLYEVSSNGSRSESICEGFKELSGRFGEEAVQLPEDTLGIVIPPPVVSEGMPHLRARTADGTQDGGVAATGIEGRIKIGKSDRLRLESREAFNVIQCPQATSRYSHGAVLLTDLLTVVTRYFADRWRRAVPAHSGSS